ncbi:MAG: helix-turn-helix domain-containing protein [Candidatus Avoscillospira sp.]
MVLVMTMNLQNLMNEKGLSRYQLSKISGIPWATLSDICSGKTHLERCNASTLVKLSSALGVSAEELLKAEAYPMYGQDGKPTSRSYLETGLPDSLQRAIGEYQKGVAEQSSLLDCLWDELYGAINACQWSYRITEEQAAYLRKKYLFPNEENDVND